MAKKKQFAGKKTKLARLPLTQALTSQAEGGAVLSAPPPLSLSLFTQAPLTWEEVSAGRGGPLAAAFLFLVRELTDLKLALQPSGGSVAANHGIYLTDRVPQPPEIIQVLRRARQSLQDLQGLLSPPLVTPGLIPSLRS
jgi:hypothetical protein